MTDKSPISRKTGAARKAGDDAQKNAADRVQAGTSPNALPIIERAEDRDQKNPKSNRGR
jgi:hypothetical protein